MLKRNVFYSSQHVSLEDLNNLVVNNIAVIKELILDWHPESTKCILTESDPSSGGTELLVQGQDSLTLIINSGSAYLSQDRLNLADNTEYMPTESVDIFGNAIVFPTGLGGSAVTRHDIIGIQYVENLVSPKNIDFLTAQKNVEKRKIYTEISFGGELAYIQGNRSDISPVDPTIPSNFMPLATLYLRDNTETILSSGEGGPTEAYLKDLRIPFLFNRRYD